MSRFQTAICYVSATALLLALAMAPPPALAHGGHGKPELQFILSPTQPISDPDVALIKIDGIEISRAEFLAYIRAVAAFQMRADLLQRDFMLHYWIAEGLSRYYPADINEVMPRIIVLGPDHPKSKELISDWIDKQAGLAGLFYYYARKAQRAGRADDPQTLAALDVFNAHIKAEFLEDLVSLGQMEPTKDGLRQFVGGISAEDKLGIAKFYADPNKVGSVQRNMGKQRWVGYRRELLKDTVVTREYLKVDSLDVAADTVLLTVGDHKLTMGQFLAVYGPVPDELNWNNIKKTRCAQVIRAYALADEIDKLGLAPQFLDEKIVAARIFYLAADQAVRDFGPQTLRISNPVIDFQFLRQVAYYLNLTLFEKIFIDANMQNEVYRKMWIDREYLGGLKWNVEEAYTGQQAQYF
ncbi:MAG: hypothetical protein P9M14_11475 [Candidatus Alcyoniella australis]|nr:hypothetical protein [Candidatus Alcyoniella australis]